MRPAAESHKATENSSSLQAKDLAEIQEHTRQLLDLLGVYVLYCMLVCYETMFLQGRDDLLANNL